jgi:hypothetical protein
MSDRKYRQKGYQDDGDPRGERRSGPRSPRPKKDGPRGRGLGAPTKTVMRCATCGREQPQGDPPLDAVCGQCGSDIHTCTHCSQFDTSRRHQCRQSIQEPIASKSKRNECQLFEPKLAQEFDSDRQEPSDPRAAFDALFKI